MRVRRLALAWILLVVLGALGLQTGLGETTPAYQATLAKAVNLRTEPSSEALVRRYLEAGDVVVLLDLNDGWYTVRFEDLLGYIREDMIEGAVLAPSVNTQGEDLEIYRTLGMGEKGIAVKLLQGTLNSLGYDAGTVDGIYGRKTQLAVADCQGYQGLEVTGIADAAFQRLLYSGNAVAAPAPAYTRPTLRAGSQAEEVAELQMWLYNLGYLKTEPSGLFDKTTEKAVQAFQKDESLTADGIVGAKTWARIDAFAAIIQGI